MVHTVSMFGIISRGTWTKNNIAAPVHRKSTY